MSESGRRLAMTRDGKLTYCTASEDQIGKGRCNHIAHQEVGETVEQFVKRMNVKDFDQVAPDVPKEAVVAYMVPHSLNERSLRLLMRHEDEEIKVMATDAFESFLEYVKTVMRMDGQIFALRQQGMGSQDYGNAVMELDRGRKHLHDAVMVKVRMLNRMCKAEGFDPLYDGDDSDASRRLVTNALFEYFKSFFE